jgi:beta-glucosidase
MLAVLYAAKTPGVDSAAIEARVADTLAKMTLDQKIQYIAGVDGFYVNGFPDLGIPRLKMSDGPVGVRNDGPTTAYPAGVNLAAAWDPDLAYRFGTGIGRDARSRAVHIWLGPGVNLSRVPQNGRNFEYLGEDPLLSGRNAAQIVRGVQDQGVVATVKHFAANNHENDRMVDSSDVDERTLRELYLRPFECAVRFGGAWAVMCAYNKLNGTYCSENGWLLNTVLKQDWGFKGVLMSDWGAVHSTLGPATNGLDLEMPGPDFTTKDNLKPLMDSGQVKVSDIDDKVRRILRLTYSMSYDKRPQLNANIPRDDPKNAAVALQIAREGTVLLKNQNNLLPLDRSKVKRILVVGPDAEPAVTGGGGSSYTQPFNSLSIVDALKKVAGPGVQIDYRPVLGNSIKAAIASTKFDGAIHAEYWDNPDLKGPSVITRDEDTIDHEWLTQPVKPIQSQIGFSARYIGKLVVPVTGKYLLLARNDDGMRVFIDGNLAIDDWNDHGATTHAVPVQFDVAGEHELKVEYYDRGGEAIAQVGLAQLEGALERDLPTGSVEDADAVIAAIGFGPSAEGEGQDRPFELPYLQRQLMDNLVSRSSKVIVLNHSGAGVDLSPWADKSGAILQDWYPGENGNQGVAEILFGDTNPSGKLPTSFPKTLAGTYYETAYPPKDHHLAYTEGLNIGYRWLETNHVEPLFPFGFGLSYTTFKLSNLHVKKHGSAVIATLTLQNTGARAGAEVVQAYTSKPDSKLTRPAIELKAFQRVALKPGEKRQVTLTLEPYWLSYWNLAGHKWAIEPGQYQLQVGTSSKDLPLTAAFKE